MSPSRAIYVSVSAVYMNLDVQVNILRWEFYLTKEIIALAYRSCQVLGFNKKVATEDNESDKSVEFEFRRRCFWSCWISTCIVMQPVSCIESAWREVAMLPLPCSLSSGLSDSEIPFNQMMDEDWNSLAARSPTDRTQLPTATGLLIKIVGVW